MPKSIKLTFKIYCCLMCFVTCALTSCENPKKNAPKKSRHVSIAKKAELSKENDIVTLIMNLDEVKRKTAEVIKGSKGKRTLVTYVETTPTTKDPYYTVKVAEDNGGSLVAYYTFAVDNISHQISYYDDIDGSMISLEQWRKTTPAEDR